MSSKKPKAAATDDELGELFSGLDTDAKAKKPTTSKPKKPAPASAAAAASGDGDILAELESQLTSEKPSRPHTPRIKDAAPSASAAGGAKQSPATTRKSTESARSLRNSFTPSATSSDQQEEKKQAPAPEEKSAAQSPQSGGGGWWGGFLSTATATATAAMKQAEAAVKEMQQNEEAKKWADQVRGNVGALRGLGDELRQRALPTFTNILHTLAPPISSHERLLVHITHDFVGYPALDPMIHGVFGRVMAQVEGGDLLVVQRGHESGGKSSNAGWQDGPWWRQSGVPREMGVVSGLIEGTKLCRASAEGYATEYFTANGGLDQAKIRATEALSESNPVRTSNLFLAVQAVSTEADDGLFARSSAKEKESAHDDKVAEEICFAIFILDPIHELEFSTISQALPAKWIRWLDSSSGPMTPTSGADDEEEESPLPEEIRELVEIGGVDPREWVAEWVEETLTLSVGVVAQRYVARRMGVGDGALGRGKRSAEDIIQDGAGEAARAGLI